MPTENGAGGAIDLSWILDVLAIIIAAGAAYYAYRANQIAKAAPAEARTAATRDLIREALIEALTSFALARNAQNLGEDIPEVPGQIPSAVTTIERLGRRLPEGTKLSSIQAKMEVTRMQWDGARRAESDLVDAKKNREWWQERVTNAVNAELAKIPREAVANADSNITRLERMVVAKRSELMNALDEATTLSQSYVDDRDSADRSAFRE